MRNKGIAAVPVVIGLLFSWNVPVDCSFETDNQEIRDLYVKMVEDGKCAGESCVDSGMDPLMDIVMGLSQYAGKDAKQIGEAHKFRFGDAGAEEGGRGLLEKFKKSAGMLGTMCNPKKELICIGGDCVPCIEGKQLTLCDRMKSMSRTVEPDGAKPKCG